MDEQKIKGILDFLDKNTPRIHEGGGQTWSLHEDILNLLAKDLTEESRVVETGMGFSTLFFAALGVYHTAIGPSADEVERIREYCASHNISLDKTDFIIKSSTDAVWDLDDRNFDLVIIDGHHGFPVPMIDWFYLSSRLNPQGIVAVDDVQVCTGAELADFMDVDPQWQRVWRQPYSKTAVYRCLNGFELRRLQHQPYVMKNSRLTKLKYKWTRGGWYLLRGDLGGLFGKLRNRPRPRWVEKSDADS